MIRRYIIWRTLPDAALARMRAGSGDWEGAEALSQQAADAYAFVILAWMCEEAGDREGAEALAQQAAEDGDAHALVRLAEMREEAGDRAGAERLRSRRCPDTCPVSTTRHWPKRSRMLRLTAAGSRCWWAPRRRVRHPTRAEASRELQRLLDELESPPNP